MQYKKEKIQSPDSVLLYGRHAVISALQNPQRKISKIMCTQENFKELNSILQQNNTDKTLLQVVERKEIEKLLPQNSVHQGFLLFCSKLKDYTIEEICDKIKDHTKANIMILDQVTDPQNIGTIIRSCVAFGCDALIMQDKNSPQETSAIVKASVGTIEHLPIIRVTNISRTIEKLKDYGFWVVGLDGYAKETISTLDKNGKIAIVMGSEGKGMRRLVEESCDISVKIPMSENVESLNVATAASIILYELYK